MKRSTIPLILSVTIVTLVCSCTSRSEMESQITKVKKTYQDSLAILKEELTDAKNQIELLQYPADQRFQKAKDMIDDGELGAAKKEIDLLKQLFPNSKEANASATLLARIDEIQEAKRKEEERIKALGFKAIPELTSVKIYYNTAVFSSISVGNRFIFDAYDDRWFYRDADRGCKYVTMQMAITSTDHNPRLPQLALYTINGDKMHLVGKFDTEFARWRDYGAYLGNYHDSSNDFAKVSTVKFKLGLQVDNEQLAKPYAIVLMKKNVLSYHYDRFQNPPISYVGSADYPSTLSIDAFKDNYVMIKRYNLK